MFGKKQKRIKALESYLGVAFVNGEYDGYYIQEEWGMMKDLNKIINERNEAKRKENEAKLLKK